jgi:hypothetical protein
MNSPRVLRDHPLIARLERRAVFFPALAADAADRDDELAEISRAIFGVAFDDIGPTDPREWEETPFGERMKPLPPGVEEAYDAAFEKFAGDYLLADAPDWDQVKGFAALGWDVTDENGRPLLVLRRFSNQLLAAIRGEYGAKLPGEIPTSAERWAEGLEQDKSVFLATKHRTKP